MCGLGANLYGKPRGAHSPAHVHRLIKTTYRADADVPTTRAHAECPCEENLVTSHSGGRIKSFHFGEILRMEDPPPVCSGDIDSRGERSV